MTDHLNDTVPVYPTGRFINGFCYIGSIPEIDNPILDPQIIYV